MKLIKIPIQQPFLKTAVSYFLSENKSLFPDFSSLGCVFPSKRAAYYFKKRLSEEIDGIFIPPRLFSIVEFCNWLISNSGEERVFPGKPILNLLLWNTLKNYGKELENLNASRELLEDFLKFAAIGEKLGSFFQELEKEEVYFNDLKKETLYSDYEKHIELLEDIFVSYKEMLKANGFLDDAERLKKVEEFLSTSPALPLKKLYFFGFLAITKKEKKIVNTLSRLLPVEWITWWEENDFMRKNIEGLEFDETLKISCYPQILPEIEVFQCQNTMEEIAFVIKAIENANQKNIPWNEIAVVLPDESLAVPLISFLEKMGIPYNYSAGLPFKTSLSYAFVKSICEVREADFYWSDFLSFLKHPFLKMMNDYARKVEENIENEKKVRFNIFTEHIEGYSKEEEILRDIFSLCNADKIETFCQKLRHILDKYSREFISIHERDAYHEILDEMEFLSKIYNRFDFHSTVHLFLSLGNEKRIPIYGERENGVQILGVLEARGIDFKAVVVPSLMEGVFPKESEKEYFLNTYIRKRVNLPTREDREALFACYFDELSKHPYVYLASRVNEKKGEEESRFLYPFQSKRIGAKILFPQTVQKSINIKRGLPEKRDLYKKLLNINYSPTSINDFLFCPYKFYLKNILNIPEPRKWKGEMEAVDYGIVVHDALKKIYQKGKPGPEIKQLFERELFSKVRTFYDGWRIKIYMKRFETFFNEEEKRFDEGWKIKELEMKKEAKYRLKNNTVIKIEGIIDRIDERDGKYAILDYKTGYIKKTYMKKKNELVNVQLPFYALLLDKTGYTKLENIVELGFYDLKKDFCLKTEKIDMKRFQEELEEIFTLILNEDCPFCFTEQEEKCDMCLYKPVCRRWLKW